jgi:hypothetical protein
MVGLLTVSRLNICLAYVVALVFVQMQSLQQPSRPSVSSRGGRCGVFVVFVHFGSDPVGTGVVELLENCQCALPGDPGELRITKVMVGVAEGVKAVGFVVTVAELTAQVDGLLVAGYGLFVVAEMSMGVAQAVVCLGQAKIVIDLALLVEGLLAADEGLLVVAELSVKPAHRVKCSGLPSAVSCRLE